MHSLRSIALVDDDASILRALGRLLRIGGFQTHCFDSGALLLASPLARTAACFVLDVHLEGLNGFQICERLREAGFVAPVIFITGHDSPETRDRALGLGASDYLRKPFDASQLLDAVAAAINATEPAQPEG